MADDVADTVAITAGSGTTIGTDEVTIGAVLQHVQRMKLVDGADGGTALIGGDATNGLDVDVTRLPGDVAHDGADTGNPIKVGGYAKAAAPADVSADADRVNAWFLRNGAQATVVTAAGALIGGDATNGLDVDVTRLPALVAGTAKVGDVGVSPYQVRIQVSPTCSTSAYASADAMGGQMTFANAVRASGGSGMLLGVTVFSKTTGLAWTGLELWMFDRSVSVAADNAANSFSDADMLFALGAPIKLSDWVVGTNGDIVSRDVQRAFVLNGTSLFAQLVTRSAITLVGTTDIAVTLDISQS